jgi:hypothetical protein
MAATKRNALELATRQSQNAQRVTRAIRAHGWKTHWRAGESVESDDAYRRETAQEALDFARIVERDARAIRTHIEAWARTQGAT